MIRVLVGLELLNYASEWRRSDRVGDVAFDLALGAGGSTRWKLDEPALAASMVGRARGGARLAAGCTETAMACWPTAAMTTPVEEPVEVHSSVEEPEEATSRVVTTFGV